MTCWTYAERSSTDAGVLSRNDGSSDGSLDRMSLGGSIGRYEKCSLDKETISRDSWPKQSKLDFGDVYQSTYIYSVINMSS